MTAKIQWSWLQRVMFGDGLTVLATLFDWLVPVRAGLGTFEPDHDSSVHLLLPWS